MMKTNVAWFLLGLWAFAATGCRHEAPAKNAWIHGSPGERWETVEKHLRGLDVAMVEIGYRYQELYWAGMDSNWAYADYQLTKIKLSLENALERRPARGASATELFLPLLDGTKQAIATRDRAEFEGGFGRLTAGCNSCHVAERVATFRVEAPSVRQSPIRAPR